MKGYYLITIFLFVSNFTLFGQDIQSELLEIWVNGNWEKSRKKTNTYNLTLDLTNGLIEDWDSTANKWNNSVKQLYFLNPNGLNDSVLVQAYDTNLSIWINSVHLAYGYNNLNLETYTTFKYWENNKWRKSRKELKSYNINNLLDTLTTQSWDSTTTSWDSHYQSIFDYDTNGLISLRVNYNRNSASQWSFVGRTNYYYDNSNNLDSTLYERLINNIWTNSGRTSYYYTGGTLSRIIHSQWDGWTMNWENYIQELHAKDSSRTSSQIIYQEWNNSWVNSERTTKIYVSSTGLSESQSNFKVILYPNPSSISINVQINNDLIGKEYTIFNQFGQNVLKGNLLSEINSVNISTLPKGFYFLTISNDSRDTFKFIKVNDK
jgi:hypothetical protein